MYDLHCHASFSADPAAFSGLIEASDLQVLSATVTPGDHARACALCGGAPSVRIAAGLHPWWIGTDGKAADAATKMLLLAIGHTRFVGEIGLDFSPAHICSKDAQLTSLERVLEACARLGDKVITMHSVRATSDLLDLIEQTRCTETCTCIIHWFSGTSDELQRAIGLGCFFSVGERMLQTKRGRAYVRAIPEGRLLLETDLPEQAEERDAPAQPAEERARIEFDALQASLGHALEAVLALNGPHTRSSIEAASRKLLA